MLGKCLEATLELIDNCRSSAVLIELTASLSTCNIKVDGYQQLSSSFQSIWISHLNFGEYLAKMGSPKPKADNKKKSINAQTVASVMVGVAFDEGIILAINSVNNLIYYLDDHIYCCASNAGFDRDALIGVSTKLEDVARTNNHRNITVSQALDMISKVYEQAEVTELLLAGEDVTGLHLVALKAPSNSARVNYAALGAGAAEAAEYLERQWRPALDVKQAEALARRAVTLGNMNKLGIDLCILFGRPAPH